jgi:hypothetical protein
MKTKNINKKTRKNRISPNHFTRKQKQEIANQIYNFTSKDVLEDFNKLKKIGCEYHKQRSKVGNNVVNKYTAVERLNTRGLSHYNFYDIWEGRKDFKKIPGIKKLADYYRGHLPNYPEIKVWFRIFNLYYSAISIFKPLFAMDVYCKYNAKNVLDFTMGWGGRLVGACALNINKYIGIDNNKYLKNPYNKLSRFLRQHSSTKIELHFQDALTIDYSKMDYDLVLTSPPYYNIEVYGNSTIKKKDEWNSEFYIPLFKTTFSNLKKGGYYCINVSEEIYVNVLLKLFGEPIEQIHLTNFKRSSKEKYKEFIYVWIK